MCIGCRRRDARAVLVRVVVSDVGDGPRIVVDLAKTRPGRGAWLHADADCVSAAVRRRAVARALRAPSLTVTSDDLAEVIGVDPAPITNNRLRTESEQVAEDMSTP
ncbi:MAG: DUF448 domain-containing protein [Gordonia sp. (in: high G+C Gram-positive bacteria)]